MLPPGLDHIPHNMGERATLEGWEKEASRPKLLPNTWKILDIFDDGWMYIRQDMLKVISSAAREQDGKRWRHLSISRQSRVPTYEEMMVVRNLFLGEDAHAIQVFPPKAQHISIFRFCLHLWHCIDGNPLPDFARGGDSI